MAQFHHHPDGLVYVRANDGRVYCDTTANFAADFGEPSILPTGIIERLYDDGKKTARHHLFDAAYNQVPGGVQSFEFGDLAIQGIELLLKCQAARNTPPPEPLPALTITTKPPSLSIGTTRV